MAAGKSGKQKPFFATEITEDTEIKKKKISLRSLRPLRLG